MDINLHIQYGSTIEDIALQAQQNSTDIVCIAEINGMQHIQIHSPGVVTANLSLSHSLLKNRVMHYYFDTPTTKYCIFGRRVAQVFCGNLDLDTLHKGTHPAASGGTVILIDNGVSMTFKVNTVIETTSHYPGSAINTDI